MGQKLSDRLVTSLPWLDGVAEKLKMAYAPMVGEKAPLALKDALVGTWLGHPLHPAVVVLPLGLWTSSLALDVAGEERAADLTLGLGLGSAMLAAVTGAAQWQDVTTEEKPRRLGTLHALVNSVATGLYAASWIARRTDHRRLGWALSTTGYGVVSAGSWLGGDLAYDLGIGVNHAAFPEPPTEWIEVCKTSKLTKNKPVRVEAEGVPILLIKHDDGIHAIGAVCPHLGGPLDEGEIEDECVTCPWHASVFDLRDGSLVHGPATSSVAAYEVKVEGTQVSVRAIV